MRICKVCGTELLTRQKNYCSNTCKFSDSELNARRTKNKKSIFNKRAVCLICGWETRDCENLGGHARKHIETVHTTSFTSVQDHYTIMDDPRELFECPECGWTTYDITNTSGAITVHIRDAHDSTITEWVDSHPEHEIIFDRLYAIHKRNNKSTVTCELCGESFQKISNSHLREIHGITMDVYKEQFPFAETVCTRLSELHSEYTTEMNKTMSFKRQSSAELELSSILSEYVDVVECDKTFGVEFDLFIPDKLVAIEVNGLLYHSENYGGKGKNYHLDKTKVAERNGIHLIHVFEDEWMFNKNLVVKKILHVLGVGDQPRVFARKCDIREVTDNDVVAEFLDANHIQGYRSGGYKYGAYTGDVLVAVMVFGNLRKALGSSRSDGVFELVRFATDIDIVGVGLFSKMLTHFIREVDPDEIISFADRRWSSSLSNVYETNGFTFDGATKPNYWYIINKRRKHRYNYTKHKIVEMGGNPNKSEWQNMIDSGIDRVWDCGQLKYVFRRG